ncbi:Cbwd1 [Symbiodinium natans]|uniref:Cbwd1 protein n=1 Tax=Symbiodinium natans TaxID=878477 RepID=A0A812T5W6_9DINO|nr:Cbwd1 [Symbiodinium natans]
MAVRMPLQQSYGSTLVHGPPVAMAQVVVQPGSQSLPLACTVHMAKEGHSQIAPTVPMVHPHAPAAFQPQLHPLQPLLNSKSVDRLFRAAPPALADAVRSWAPVPTAKLCASSGQPQTPQKVWTTRQAIKAACALPLQVPSSVSTTASQSPTGGPAGQGSLMATPASEKPERHGRLDSLREQLVQASVELHRMQATLADMGTKLPAAWTGACSGKLGNPKSASSAAKESPLQAVQRAVKQLQGNLEESLNSAEKVPASPDTRNRTFSASSREPSVSSLMKGRNSQQASPVQRTRPHRQASAPARRPSESSTSSRGASISCSTRSIIRRSDARERMRRRVGQSLASTMKDLRLENSQKCDVEDSEGRSVSSDIRPRKPRPPMAAVLQGSSRRSPGQVLSEARRWCDAGNSTGVLRVDQKLTQDQGLSEQSPTGSSSERLPKPTLTPVLRCR